MSYAIFDDKIEAEAFAVAVDQAKRLPTPGEPPAEFPYGWTLHWADVLAHPDGARWAYPLEGCGAACPSSAVEVSDLPPGWVASSLEPKP